MKVFPLHKQSTTAVLNVGLAEPYGNYTIRCCWNKMCFSSLLGHKSPRPLLFRDCIARKSGNIPFFFWLRLQRQCGGVPIIPSTAHLWRAEQSVWGVWLLDLCLICRKGSGIRAEWSLTSESLHVPCSQTGPIKALRFLWYVHCNWDNKWSGGACVYASDVCMRGA